MQIEQTEKDTSVKKLKVISTHQRLFTKLLENSINAGTKEIIQAVKDSFRSASSSLDGQNHVTD